MQPSFVTGDIVADRVVPCLSEGRRRRHDVDFTWVKLLAPRPQLGRRNASPADAAVGTSGYVAGA